jgi:hypothetical protein
MEGFPPVSALGASVALSTIQGTIALPYDCKITRVAFATTGVVSGTVAMQIIYGPSATNAGVGTVDTNSVNGTAVWASNVTIPTTTAAGTILTFFPDVPDAIYQSYNLDNRTLTTPQTGVPGCLTLRFVTAGSSGITLITAVELGLKPVNQHSAVTGLPTPAGNYTGWDPSTF